MPDNYVLLEKVTVGAAGAASIVFNNIPQTGYTDLVVRISSRSSISATLANIKMTFNVSGGTYVRREIYAENAAYGSETAADNIVGDTSGNSTTANVFGSAEVYIPNYTSSNPKCFTVDSVSENNSNNSGMWLLNGTWSSTVAINSITIFPSTATWMLNSTFTLYGVAKLNVTPTVAPKAAGGDIIQTDGTYWYHAFLTTGTFTPAVSLSCDVLTIAGGGGGGGQANNNSAGGGGGAGGLRYFAAQAIASTAQTVTVGAGGAGGNNANGTSGSNSQFAALTLSTGGGGGGTMGNDGLAGGSGGGAGTNYQLPARSGGAASPSGQGNAGGNSTATAQDSNFNSGGGGGAGAVGGNGSSATGGNGGAGLNTYSSWATATGTGVSGFYAGGGGGVGFTTVGTGASGGGNGDFNGSPKSAVANTGSGGGGGAYKSGVGTPTIGGNGGSGIVIVRYLVA